MSDEQDKTLVERLEWLVNIEVGTTWTEYHWREALQICQDVFALTMGAAQENKTAEDLISRVGPRESTTDSGSRDAEALQNRGLSNKPDAVAHPILTYEEAEGLLKSNFDSMPPVFFTDPAKMRALCRKAMDALSGVPMDTELLDWLDSPEASITDVNREIRLALGGVTTYRQAIRLAMERQREHNRRKS